MIRKKKDICIDVHDEQRTHSGAARNCSITWSAKKTLPVVANTDSIERWELRTGAKGLAAVGQPASPPTHPLSHLYDMCRCSSSGSNNKNEMKKKKKPRRRQATPTLEPAAQSSSLALRQLPKCHNERLKENRKKKNRKRNIYKVGAMCCVCLAVWLHADFQGRADTLEVAQETPKCVFHVATLGQVCNWL